MKYAAIILLSLLCTTTHAQIITTVAGGGSVLGNNIPATSASLNTTAFASFDAAGNFYFAEPLSNERVRMIDNSGRLHTVAGTGVTGFSGDGGPATAAQLHQLNAVIVDLAGNIYISDYVNYRIRKVDVATNIIHTIAGTGANASSGDGGPATAAEIVPGGLALDTIGNLYVIDVGNATIRKIDTAGIITRIAGNGIVGYTGDGGAATAASLRPDLSICYSKMGDLYFGCVNRIRKINLNTGIITTFAGNGVGVYNGEGVLADTAGFTCPFAICIDEAGQLYIGDYSNQRVRVIDTAHLIYTVAGTGTAGFSGDGGAATLAKIHWPEGVTIDNCGNLFIADMLNKRIRKVTFNPYTTPTITVTSTSTAAVGATVTVNAAVSGAGTGYSIKWYRNAVLFGTTTVPVTTYTKGAGTDTITARVLPAVTYCYDSATAAPCFVSESVSVPEQQQLQGITITPNPARNRLYLSAAGVIHTITITNLLGQTLHQQQNTTTTATADISALPPGTYLLRLNETYVRRFVKE